MSDDSEDLAAWLASQEGEAMPGPAQGMAEFEPSSDGTFGLVHDPAAERWPPLAHDFAVYARTPAGWQGAVPLMPDSGDFERLHERSWGLSPGVFVDQDGDGGFANAPDAAEGLDRQARDWAETSPGQAENAVRSRECDAFASVALMRSDASSLCWEVARLAFPSRGLSVLEQVAFFWAATAEGAPGFVGSFNRDLANPLALAVHPNGATLRVRWVLLRHPQEQVSDTPLVAADPAAIPRYPADIGLPRELSPAFAWGSPYTVGWRLILPGDGGNTLRLFAIVEATAGQDLVTWNLQIYGRLAGWSQAGGDGLAVANARIRQ